MPITDPGLIRPTFSTKTSGSTIPLTFTSTAIPADSLIFAVFAFDNTGVTTPTVSSVSKPAGETASWSITNVDSFQSGSAAGAKGAVAWIKTATAWSAGETITATLSASVATRVGVATVFYGVGTVSGSIASEQHGSTIALSSGVIPSTGQLVVGGVWTENSAAPAADTDTLDGSWSSEPVNTSGGNAQTNVGMRLHYKITNASSGNPQVLNASVVDGGAALAVFTVAPATHSGDGNRTATANIFGTATAGPPTATFVDNCSTVDQWNWVDGDAFAAEDGMIRVTGDGNSISAARLPQSSSFLLRNSYLILEIPEFQVMGFGGTAVAGAHHAGGGNNSWYGVARNSSTYFWVCTSADMGAFTPDTGAKFFAIYDTGTTVDYYQSADGSSWSLITSRTHTPATDYIGVGVVATLAAGTSFDLAGVNTGHATFPWGGSVLAADGNASAAASISGGATVTGGPQLVPPFADGTLVGAWVNEVGGTTNLYQSIDEAAPGSLSDYVQSPTAPAAEDFYRARFNIPNTPTENTGHIVRIRHGKTATGGQDISCVVYVRQGTDTVVAQWSFTTTDMDTTDRTDVLTLSEAEAGSITDYDTLRVEVSPTVTGGGQKREYRVYWMEFEAPWAPNSGAGSRANTATITGDALVTVFGAGSPTDVTATLAGEASVFKDASGTTAATVATGSTELLTIITSGVATSATTARAGDSLLTKVVSGDTPASASVQGAAFVLRPTSGTTTATVTPSGDIVTGDMADGTASAVATLDGSVLLTRGVTGTTEASASHAVVAATTAFASGTLSSTTSLAGDPLVTRITSGDASITATISGFPDGITEVSGSLPATGTASGTGNVIGLDTPFLTAEAIGLAQIDLDWTTITGATGYDIERDGQIIVINHQQTSYSDTDVITGLTYVYRVRARKAI